MLHALLHLLSILGAITAGGFACTVVSLSIMTNAEKIGRALRMTSPAPLLPDPVPIRMRVAERPRATPLRAEARRAAA